MGRSPGADGGEPTTTESGSGETMRSRGKGKTTNEMGGLRKGREGG